MEEIKSYSIFEEKEEKIKELEEELKEAQKENEIAQKTLDELNANNCLIDIWMLLEYLDDRHLLTDELKNTIELWNKLYNVKDDLCYYSDALWEN